MLITTRQFLSSVWLLIALIIATLLAIALPGEVNAQAVATNQVVSEGYASWYNLGQHGAKTASGERYDNKAFTAAHPSLPFDTMVKVTNMENNMFVVVRINDRLKSGSKHIIDLSGAAAQKIDLFKAGTAEVRLDPVDTSNLTMVSFPEPDTRETVAASKVSAPTKSTDNAGSGKIQKASVSSSSSREIYTLQLGSFSTRERAQILADQFSDAWIAKVETNGDISFRVYYSRYEQEKPARVAQNDLWTKGQDSFLRKVAS